MTEIQRIRENRKPEPHQESVTKSTTDAQVSNRSRDIGTKFRQVAMLLRMVASNPAHLEHLLNQIDSISNPIAQTAILEALGLDREVADGITWRRQQGMPRFDSKEIANIGVKFAKGQYGPMMSDIQEALRIQAGHCDQAAAAFQNLSMLEPARLEILSDVMDGMLLSAAAGADVAGIASLFKGGSGSLFGGTGILGPAVTLVSLAKNGCDWAWNKKLALLPGANLTDLTRAYLEERNNFGKGMLQFMLAGLPGAGMLCELADRVYGKREIAPLPNISVFDMLESATRRP